jgi:hypothetical protein
VPGTKVLLNARRKLTAIGSQILSDSKANIRATADQKTLGGRRDLLAILMKANLSSSIPESQRLTDAEVIAREDAV